MSTAALRLAVICCAFLAVTLVANKPHAVPAQKHLLWGDTHLHSSYSADSYLYGNFTVDPETAYRYARGEPVVHPFHGARVQIDTPLDFLVVSDHAEFLGGIRQKIAVVTGASSGIGRVTAITLAQAGATVIATARRESLLQEVSTACRQHTPDSCHITGDLGDKAFAQQLVDETVGRYGRIDILVNNAAVPMHRSLYEISVEEAEEVMRINFLSCLWTSFAAIPHMLLQGEGGEEGGVIVNVSSFVATVAPTHETIYAASKGAMNSF